jgi:hypothetical protein
MPSLVLFLFGLFLQPAVATSPITPAANSDVLVVLKIDGLNDEMLARVSAQVGKQRNYTLEYSCVWSDVLVLRMSDVNANERGDVVTLCRRLLTSAGIEKGVEFLHVHVEPKGLNKC